MPSAYSTKFQRSPLIIIILHIHTFSTHIHSDNDNYRVEFARHTCILIHQQNQQIFKNVIAVEKKTCRLSRRCRRRTRLSSLLLLLLSRQKKREKEKEPNIADICTFFVVVVVAVLHQTSEVHISFVPISASNVTLTLYYFPSFVLSHSSLRYHGRQLR